MQSQKTPFAVVFFETKPHLLRFLYGTTSKTTGGNVYLALTAVMFLLVILFYKFKILKKLQILVKTKASVYKMPNIWVTILRLIVTIVVSIEFSPPVGWHIIRTQNTQFIWLWVVSSSMRTATANIYFSQCYIALKERRKYVSKTQYLQKVISF